MPTLVVTTQMLIRRPVADVFEAFVNPAITTKFWFTKSSGPLETGKTIRWDWEMYGVSAEVTVKAVELKYDYANGKKLVMEGLAPLGPEYRQALGIRGAQSRQCPKCGMPMPPRHQLCVRCGRERRRKRQVVHARRWRVRQCPAMGTALFIIVDQPSRDFSTVM